MKIEIGDRFNNGVVEVTVTKVIDKNSFECSSYGDVFVATKDFFNDWTKVITNKHCKKRINAVSLKDVCINVLKTTKNAMTATEIYKYIKDNNMFVFSEKAKTPANTIHARIREYINKNPNQNIAWKEKGKFLFVDKKSN